MGFLACLGRHGARDRARSRTPLVPAMDHRPAPTHVFAILRIDAGPEDLAQRITVKEVVASFALAESEVVRLDALNAPKGRRYIMQVTRLYAPGTSAGSRTPA